MTQAELKRFLKIPKGGRLVAKVYSRDQSLDKTSFEFANIFQAVQSCAISAKSIIIILKLPKSMIT